MNDQQRAVIKQHFAKLCKDMKYALVEADLELNTVLSAMDKQLIDSENRLEQGKSMSLVRLLEARDNGWEALLSALDNVGQTYLSNLLRDSYAQVSGAGAARAPVAASLPQAAAGDRKQAYSTLTNMAFDTTEAFTDEGLQQVTNFLKVKGHITDATRARVLKADTAGEKVLMLCEAAMAAGPTIDDAFYAALESAKLHVAAKRFNERRSAR